MGRRHRPFFRINAIEKSKQRNGKILEALGWYDPLVKDKDKAISLNADRIKAWLDQGALPSESVGDLLVREGLIDAEKWNAARTKRIAPKMKRINAERAANEATAAAEAAQAAAAKEAEAKAAASSDEASAEEAKAE